MKNSILNLAGCVALASIMSLAGPSISVADETVVVHRDVIYTHDTRGWYDENHHRHDFVYYQGHRGYWNWAHGQRVWVTVPTAVVHVNL